MTDWPHKIDHLSLPVSDLEQAVHFYTAALAPAGLGLISSGEQRAAFGMGPMPYLVVRRTNAAVAPIHLAFLAETRAAVASRWPRSARCVMPAILSPLASSDSHRGSMLNRRATPL